MVLGELEQLVMSVLWRSRVSLAVKDVQARLESDEGRSLAYTTVMTVLDRLAKKGVADRELDGRAWLYRPRKTCVDLHVEEILALLSGCGEGHARRVLAEVRHRLPEVTQVGRHSCGRPGDPERLPLPDPTISIEEWCHGCPLAEESVG